MLLLVSQVLKRMPENHKRVYLAKYLMPVQIPEDMAASDDGLRDVFQQYKQLIEQFKQVHKAVDKLQAGNKSEGAKTIMSNLEKVTLCGSGLMAQGAWQRDGKCASDFITDK